MNFLRQVKQAIGTYLHHTDRLLILLCILASSYGYVLVYSAAKTAGAGIKGTIVQLLCVILGLIAAIVISKIDYETISAFWPVWTAIALLLMILTFTPLGLQVPGTDDKAWLGVRLNGNDITFQPAELLKIVFIITFARHLSKVQDHMNRPLTFLLLCLHGMIPVGLTFLQGDHGTGVVFLFMFAAMMFAAGLKLIYFLIGGIAVTGAVPVLWSLLDEQKKARLLSLIFIEEYAGTTGWQQYLALISMGTGRLWGVGFGNGTGGNYQLYARNNDFIFTVACEEFGFIGGLALIVLLLLIVFEILRCSIRAKDRMGSYICIGMMSLIAFQSMINIGMTVRLLPVIGITLPFFSAGGSSVATLYLGIGLVLSVYYTSRTKARHTIFTSNY